MAGSVVRRWKKAGDRLRTLDLASLSAEARVRERHKRIAFTAVASGTARAVGIATTLVSVPLTVRYLGTEQFGLWATITSFTALLGFADLGLSNGLVNGISEAHARDDQESARQYVSSAFFILVAIGAVLLAAFGLTYHLVPWARLFNVDTPSAVASAGPALAVFVLITVVGLPFGVVARIQSGYQEGFANSGWQGLGSVLSLVGLVVAVALQAGLPWLVLAVGLGPLMASLLNGVSLIRRRPWLSPSLRSATLPAARRIVRLGLMFFIVQIGTVVGFQTDNVIVARIMGAQKVAQYAIPMKLFMLAPMVLGLGLMPLWPAYREALVRRDLAWVRRVLARSIGIAAAWGLLSSLLLVRYGASLIQSWAGHDIAPTPALLLALGAWSTLVCLGSAMAMFMNAMNLLVVQALCVSAMVVLNLALSIVLTRSIGLPGPAWGSALSSIVTLIIPYAVYVAVWMRRLGFERGERVTT